MGRKYRIVEHSYTPQKPHKIKRETFYTIQHKSLFGIWITDVEGELGPIETDTFAEAEDYVARRTCKENLKVIATYE
jgi:hypothetical protein